MNMRDYPRLLLDTKSSKGTVPLLLFYISQSHCWIWCWTFIAIFNHAFSELLSPICFSEIKLHSNSISIYKDQNVFTLKSGSSCLVENLLPNAKCRPAMKALFLYFNLRVCVILDSISCSFTFIYIPSD
jgi:hypothetical protein